MGNVWTKYIIPRHGICSWYMCSLRTVRRYLVLNISEVCSWYMFYLLYSSFSPEPLLTCVLLYVQYCTYRETRIQRRDNKEPDKYPRHPAWVKLSEHIDDRDKTGALIRAGRHRADLCALQVFWVLPHFLYTTVLYVQYVVRQQQDHMHM